MQLGLPWCYLVSAGKQQERRCTALFAQCDTLESLYMSYSSGHHKHSKSLTVLCAGLCTSKIKGSVPPAADWLSCWLEDGCRLAVELICMNAAVDSVMGTIRVSLLSQRQP